MSHTSIAARGRSMLNCGLLARAGSRQRKRRTGRQRKVAVLGPGRGLVSLSSPVPRAAGLPRVTAPRAATGISCELARAGSKLVLDGHRCSNRTRTRYIAAEFDEVWVCDDSVADVDGEIIGRVARASLRHEEKVPRPVIRRAGLCDRYEGDKATRGYRGCEEVFHCVLQGVLVIRFVENVASMRFADLGAADPSPDWA
jgi:hypothetical protein